MIVLHAELEARVPLLLSDGGLTFFKLVNSQINIIQI